MDSLESRVTDLEIQITYQTKTLEELNSVIIDQQKQLEKIKRINNFLIQNIQNSNDHDKISFSTSLEQKPPHY